jgi:hypothetical protein
MRKLQTKLLILTVAFLAGTAGSLVWYMYRQEPTNRLIIPNARVDKLYFGTIDLVTQSGGLSRLRQTVLSPGDLEVRVWKGFSLSPLEGVILNRKEGNWTAQHVREIRSEEGIDAQVTEIGAPQSGWNLFWNEVTQQGLTSLSPPTDERCSNSVIDGTSYVVEISQDGTYRNGAFHLGLNDCPESEQMEKVGQYIGGEIDSGREQCQTTEWFACATYMQQKSRDTQ